MRIGICNTSILRNDRCCRLFTDSRYSRNIVCRIAHQRLDIDKLDWRHLIFFLYLSGILILDLRDCALCFRDTDLNMIRCKL